MSDNELYSQLVITLDQLNDGILIIDADHKITYANAEMSRVLFNQELAGKNIFEARLEDISPALKNKLKIALSERKNITTMEYVKRLRAWYNVFIYPSLAYTSIIFKDKSGIERLNELYRLTHYTIENAQEYVMWVAMDGYIAYVNTSTRSKLGYSLSDKAEYKIYDIIKKLTYENWSTFRDKMIKGRSATFESVVVDNYGKKVTCEVTANYVKLKEREYIVVFIKDISQRKQAENELTASKAQAELYLDLMCHDINNINQVGIGFLELAMELGDINEPVKDYLDKTMESFRKSTELIGNVKKLQNSKNGSLQIRPVSLSDIICESIKRNANHRGREVSIRLNNTGECMVMANDLLMDVFDNLIGNAIKHSSGPLAIDIGIDTVREDGRYFYRVSVEDNGPGIPDIVKNVIFGRGDVNRQRGAAGKGLGLYLVKTLVSDFSGGVWVEDRVSGDYKQGTRVVVMLPAVDLNAPKPLYT